MPKQLEADTLAVITYIKEHPGVTNRDIAAGLGLTQVGVSAKTSQQVTARRLRRELMDSTYPPRYKLYFKTMTPPKKRRTTAPAERPVPAPSASPAPPTPQPDKPTTLEQLVSQIAAQIAESIMSQVQQQLAAHLQQPAAVLPPPGVLHPAEPAAPPSHLKKVLVVGLEPRTSGLISQEFRDALDMAFFTPDEMGKRLRDAAAHADHVICMTGFISHKQVECVKAAGAEPEFIHGGTTKLRDRLTELFVTA